MNPEIREKTIWLIGQIREVADDPDVSEGELREHLRRMTGMVEQMMGWIEALNKLNTSLRRAFWASSACAVIVAAALYYQSH